MLLVRSRSNSVSTRARREVGASCYIGLIANTFLSGLINWRYRNLKGSMSMLVAASAVFVTRLSVQQRKQE
jgi:hypothetical protein